LIKRSLYVGRFQPFHNGHLNVIDNILKKTDELIILVGSSQRSHEIENPFTCGERLTMIRLALNEAGINASKYLSIPFPDVSMHSIWVYGVISQVPKFNKVYTNEALTRRLFSEAGYMVSSIPLYKRNTLCATEIRSRILLDKNWKELVPKNVSKFIEQIKGVQRIKDLSKKN
jgi:nicotinamide-nucleotide adenylyltransferase